MFAVRFENVSRHFGLHDDSFDAWRVGRPRKIGSGIIVALSNLSFEVMPGECLGIIGENGSGKTTLLRLAAGVLQPSSGSVRVVGNRLALLELGTGFQLEMSGAENVRMYGALVGLSREEINAVMDGVRKFADIGDFFDLPMSKYSTGMMARLFFSAAFMVEPDVLLIDEIFAVGDLDFQEKSVRKILELREKKKTILLVSHDLPQVEDMCDRAILLSKGAIVDEGPPRRVTARYKQWSGRQVLEDLASRFTSSWERFQQTRAKLCELERVGEKADSGARLLRRVRRASLLRERNAINEALSFTKAELFETVDDAHRTFTVAWDAVEDGTAHEDVEETISKIEPILQISTDCEFPMRIREQSAGYLCELCSFRFRHAMLSGSALEREKLWLQFCSSIQKRLSLCQPGTLRWNDCFWKLAMAWFSAPIGNLEPEAPAQTHVRRFAALLDFLGTVLRLKNASLRSRAILEFERTVSTRLLSLDYQDAAEAQAAVLATMWQRFGSFDGVGFRELRAEQLRRTVLSNIRREMQLAGERGASEALKRLGQLLERVEALAAGEESGRALRIVEVWFEDEKGRRSSEFAAGGFFAAAMRYEAAEPIARPMFGLAIHTADGFLVTGPNTSLSWQVPEQVPCTGLVRYVVRRLPLKPGKYLVSVSASDFSGAQCYDYHDREHSFSVTGKKTDDAAILEVPAEVEWVGDS